MYRLIEELIEPKRRLGDLRSKVSQGSARLRQPLDISRRMAGATQRLKELYGDEMPDEPVSEAPRPRIFITIVGFVSVFLGRTPRPLAPDARDEDAWHPPGDPVLRPAEKYLRRAWRKRYRQIEGEIRLLDSEAGQRQREAAKYDRAAVALQEHCDKAREASVPRVVWGHSTDGPARRSIVGLFLRLLGIRRASASRIRGPRVTGRTEMVKITLKDTLDQPVPAIGDQQQVLDQLKSQFPEQLRAIRERILALSIPMGDEA